MATWTRTTTGLLQGKQSDVSMHDLRKAVDFLDARVQTPAARQALRLDRAKEMVQHALHSKGDFA